MLTPEQGCMPGRRPRSVPLTRALRRARVSGKRYAGNVGGPGGALPWACGTGWLRDASHHRARGTRGDLRDPGGGCARACPGCGPCHADGTPERRDAPGDRHDARTCYRVRRDRAGDRDPSRHRDGPRRRSCLPVTVSDRLPASVSDRHGASGDRHDARRHAPRSWPPPGHVQRHGVRADRPVSRHDARCRARAPARRRRLPHR